MNKLDAVLAIVGLGLSTLFTRSAFLWSDRELPMPGWVQRALKYAPLAAVVAIAVPEVFWTADGLLDTWRSARLWSAMAAVLYYLVRGGLFGTLAVGAIVYLALKLGLGW